MLSITIKAQNLLRRKGAKAQRYKAIWFLYAFAPFILCACILPASAETWVLDNNQDLKTVSQQSQDKFLKAVADVKMLVNTGQTSKAKKEFKALKAEFPEIAGPDLDLFIKAELLLSQKKLTRSAKTYDKLLSDYPKSKLHDAAIEREFSIGKTFLAGRKKRFLGFIPISGYAEGIGIMEKVTDHAGINSQIGTEAAVAAATNYEQRHKYSESYLKWWEVSSQWPSGEIGRQALLGMARTKDEQYNQNPETKRAFYDSSSLRTARSYYEKFRAMYPTDPEIPNIIKKLDEIYEQLAYKDLNVALFYRRTGNQTAANLYFEMVISDWPKSQAAQKAVEMVSSNTGK
jgi:hypothetical protein